MASVAISWSDVVPPLVLITPPVAVLILESIESIVSSTADFIAEFTSLTRPPVTDFSIAQESKDPSNTPPKEGRPGISKPKSHDASGFVYT
jgi:hypothetical protein